MTDGKKGPGRPSGPMAQLLDPEFRRDSGIETLSETIFKLGVASYQLSLSDSGSYCKEIDEIRARLEEILGMIRRDKQNDEGDGKDR